jgi:uncharacterized repeat protein (TIGR01451 family)
VTGVKAGRQMVQVTIRGNGAEASAQATVAVGNSGLQVQQNPTHRLILEKPNEIRIEILNYHNQPLRRISVIDTLPEEVEFIGASDRGIHRSETRTVHWLIDQLAPGQRKVVALKVQPKMAGKWSHNVVAKAEPSLEAHSTGVLQVEGFTDLAVKIIGRDPQLEVGKETVYQIRVINQGDVPATNIQLQALLPEGMTPGHAQGPTTHRGDGRQIVFSPLAKLNPHAQVVFHVGVVADAPGDRRFRVQVTSDQNRVPVAREERTLVYRE